MEKEVRPISTGTLKHRNFFAENTKMKFRRLKIFYIKYVNGFDLIPKDLVKRWERLPRKGREFVTNVLKGAGKSEDSDFVVSEFKQAILSQENKAEGPDEKR
jgi:hypothetical protein